MIISGRRSSALEGSDTKQLEGASPASPVSPTSPTSPDEADSTAVEAGLTPVSAESPSSPASPDLAVSPASPTADVTSPASPVSPTAEETQADRPEPPLSRLSRLRRRLASSNNALARGLAALLSSDRLSDETWEDFETSLLASDLGVGPTTELIDRLRQRLSLDAVDDPAQAKAVLREELMTLVDPSLDRRLHLKRPPQTPAVVLVVGVNGTGKTTTIGKLARLLVAEDQTVLLGAADTFRAAAADQLQTWGERIGVETVRGAERADPASVAFDAAQQAKQLGTNVLL
ncbi:MAG: signal recognition particle receptor subunit alpha, partial [Propionibacteriaceae bacterium]|nr:signal recognition particle receptor subunit alpha [Propionibacteriaceae bacterium]